MSSVSTLYAHTMCACHHHVCLTFKRQILDSQVLFVGLHTGAFDNAANDVSVIYDDSSDSREIRYCFTTEKRRYSSAVCNVIVVAASFVKAATAIPKLVCAALFMKPILFPWHRYRKNIGIKDISFPPVNFVGIFVGVRLPRIRISFSHRTLKSIALEGIFVPLLIPRLRYTGPSEKSSEWSLHNPSRLTIKDRGWLGHDGPLQALVSTRDVIKDEFMPEF